MAFVTFKEIDQNRAALVDESGVTTRHRTWYFIYDSHATDAITVVNDFTAKTGIRRWTTYVGADGSTDPTCRAISIDPQQTEDFGKWIVHVIYSSGKASLGGTSASPRANRERAQRAKEGMEGQQPPDDPTQLTPRVSWGHQEYQVGVRHDRDDKAIQNSAGENFVPAPTKTYTYRVLTIERGERLEQFTARGTDNYVNRVNGPEFYGYPTETVLCKSIDATLETESSIGGYWAVTYVFWINIEKWDLVLDNMGFQEKVPAPLPEFFRLQEIMLEGNVKPSSPQPLELDGRKRAPGLLPHKLTFKIYPLADFNDFGL